MAIIFDLSSPPRCGIPFKFGLIKGAEPDGRTELDGVIYVEGISVGVTFPGAEHRMLEKGKNVE